MKVKADQRKQDPIGKDIFMPKILPQLLEDGLIEPNSVLVMKEGTMCERTAKALDLLLNNKVSGQKIVVKIVF